MKYDECLQVLSPARLNKYAQASGNEKAKTLRLYQYNIKLSQRFYGVIGMFEIMLRNAINAHYKQYFNDDNWIINQARPNGLLEQEASEIVRIQRTYTNMGVYNNDKMVASFTFGFWTYLFTRRNYRIGGKTLLQIFPNKAHGLKQTDIYKQLTAIREFRNRIAHHEPICFNATRAIDTKYAKEHYELIRTYIEYMGFDSDSVLRMVEKRFSRFFVGIIFYLREVLLTLHYEKRLFEHASQPRVAGSDIRLLSHLWSRTNLSRDSYQSG